jgi:hypothetical protein
MRTARNGWSVAVSIRFSRRIVVFALITSSILAVQSANSVMGSTGKPKLQRSIGSKSLAAAQFRTKHNSGVQKPLIRIVKVSSRGNAACVRCSRAAKAKSRSKSRAIFAKAEPCHPKGYVDPKIAKNFNAAMHDLKRAGIKPMVTSTWRSSEHQAKLYNCSTSRRCRRANPGLYRAMPPGQSLHEAGLAVDLSGVAAGPRGAKRLTRRGRNIVGIMQKNGFRWRYGLADPAHFEANPRRAGFRNAKQAIARSQTICSVGKGVRGRRGKG